MNDTILGLHHVTAIAGDAQRNLDFYTKILGLRLIKRTVNFDDPGTYHFYFGNYEGSAGTILTFFPWGHLSAGRRGAGEASAVSFSVPKSGLSFWERHLRQHGITVDRSERFAESVLAFTDPDGMHLELIAGNTDDTRPPFVTDVFTAEVAIRGFYNVTLSLRQAEATEHVLTDLFGYQRVGQEGNRIRYVTPAIQVANSIDLLVSPNESRAQQGGGSIHHVAFRVPDDATQMRYRKRIADAGFNITPQIDRDYFHSLYFREMGGVLFEIATDNPGFTVDEPLEALGQHLRLPSQHEPHRKWIEAQLPVLKL